MIKREELDKKLSLAAARLSALREKQARAVLEGENAGDLSAEVTSVESEIAALKAAVAQYDTEQRALKAKAFEAAKRKAAAAIEDYNQRAATEAAELLSAAVRLLRQAEDLYLESAPLHFDAQKYELAIDRQSAQIVAAITTPLKQSLEELFSAHHREAARKAGYVGRGFRA